MSVPVHRAESPMRAPGPAARLRRTRLATSSKAPVIAAWACVVALILVSGVSINGFYTLTAIRSEMVLASLLGIAAAGQTLVVILGGIDLSIPALMTLTAVGISQLSYDHWSAASTLAVLAILWAALVLTVSRSSIGALLVGLGALGAIRWNVGRAVFAAAGVVAIAAAAIALSPTTFGLNQGLNGASSGRPGLVSGGLDLFADRPIWGYGSGSFETEYSAHNRHIGQTLSASHTIPITIAAEQGLIGELVYVALVIAALVTLFRRCRRDPARVAIACAFLALLFHTMLYADFLEDPITWTLLAIGVALALAPPVGSSGRGSELAAGDRELQQQLA